MRVIIISRNISHQMQLNRHKATFQYCWLKEYRCFPWTKTDTVTQSPPCGQRGEWGGVRSLFTLPSRGPGWADLPWGWMKETEEEGGGWAADWEEGGGGGRNSWCGSHTAPRPISPSLPAALGIIKTSRQIIKRHLIASPCWVAFHRHRIMNQVSNKLPHSTFNLQLLHHL